MKIGLGYQGTIITLLAMATKKKLSKAHNLTSTMLTSTVPRILNE